MKRASSARSAGKKKQGNEIYWILGVMAAILLILIITPFIMQSFRTFDYQGLTFTKEKFSEITVYRYPYHFSDDVGQQYLYNLYLRIDPRENKVPFDGEIKFISSEPIYVSINSTGLSQCTRSLRDVASLSNFLASNLFDIRSGTPDAEEAERLSLRHVTCDTHPNATVIIVQAGNETRIVQQNACYILSAKECDTLSAVEKFMTRALIDAR
ncbi:MAG TPA: hypothetical protein VJK03_01500 [Candidatus Nanoarchaeia archaeon]|nr:hypothetical protein [Candidatus Nanoarchaeia archaeon]